MKKNQVILILEDDPDISAMLELMLSHKGFSSIVVSRGEEVKKMVRDNIVDLIILDIFLPGMKGTEICRELKKSETTSHVPVVIMSAYPKADEISRKAGADDFIEKPFEMNDLFSHINNLLIKPHLN